MLCKVMQSFFFLFKQKTAYEMRISDWSSDVCSSDLENDKELTALFDNFVGAIEVIIAFGQTFGAAVEYAGTFVPILSRLATDFGPPIFAIGDAAVPLIADMGEQPDMMAAVAARTADLIVKHPDAKSIVQAFAVSLPLRSLVSSCAAPVATGVCRSSAASRTIAGMMGAGP